MGSPGRRTATIPGAEYTGWWVGLSLNFLAVVILVIVVAIILTLAARIADKAQAGSAVLVVVRDQTDALQDVGRSTSRRSR